jgi:choline dehydrogenase-like flavoprotein
MAACTLLGLRTHALPQQRGRQDVTRSSLARRTVCAAFLSEAGLMTTEPFDVVILGGGNAGIAVTGPARRAGMSVAMIEARDLGGTCPNRGCTPKKILVAAGHALHEIERARVHQIAPGKPKLDWAALIDRKTAIIKGVPANMARARRSGRWR